MSVQEGTTCVWPSLRDRGAHVIQLPTSSDGPPIVAFWRNHPKRFDLHVNLVMLMQCKYVYS